MKTHLAGAGYSPALIGRALDILRREAGHHGRDLYENNKAVYALLRYGVPVKTEAGQVTETVRLIDWQTPENNAFALAEEVRLKGGYANGHERRPDIVLYVNGIRQNLSNQQPEFNAWFFATVQFVFAGNHFIVEAGLPRSRPNASNTFWSMRWRTSSNRRTTRVSSR